MIETISVGSWARIRWLAFLISLAINVSPVSADVIWIKGEPEPVFGLIDEIKTNSIEMRVFKNDILGTEAGPIQSFRKMDIDQWVANVDQSRLGKLSPENFVEYRNYAEELASQKRDPVARNLARRLYLIAASDVSLRTSSLAGLYSLADTQVEKKRIEMLQTMLLPSKPPVKAAAKQNPSPATDQELVLMLDLVQALRQQDSEKAISLLRSNENRQVFSHWSQFCSVDELDLIASENQPSKSQLSKLLQIEIDVISLQTGKPLAKREAGDDLLDWGDFAEQPSSAATVVPTLDNITEFDPAKSVYREGRWVRPGSEFK